VVREGGSLAQGRRGVHVRRSLNVGVRVTPARSSSRPSTSHRPLSKISYTKHTISRLRIKPLHTQLRSPCLSSKRPSPEVRRSSYRPRPARGTSRLRSRACSSASRPTTRDWCVSSSLSVEDRVCWTGNEGRAGPLRCKLAPRKKGADLPALVFLPRRQTYVWEQYLIH
jgi:hypothetical protein